MGQKAGEKWTAAAKLQPTFPKSDRLLGLWLLLGLLAFVALPWYLPQNLGLWASLGVWGGAETAGGAWQVLRHSRPWLALDALGLAAAAVAWCLPAGPRQGRWLVAGAGVALAGLLASAFGIGAQGWSFEALTALWGALPQGQPGMGLGGGLALLVLRLDRAPFGALLGHARIPLSL